MGRLWDPQQTREAAAISEWHSLRSSPLRCSMQCSAGPKGVVPHQRRPEPATVCRSPATHLTWTKGDEPSLHSTHCVGARRVAVRAPYVRHACAPPCGASIINPALEKTKRSSPPRHAPTAWPARILQLGMPCASYEAEPPRTADAMWAAAFAISASAPVPEGT